MTRLRYLNLYTDLILLTSQIEDIALKKVIDGRKKGDSGRKKGEIHRRGRKREMEIKGGKKRNPP